MKDVSARDRVPRACSESFDGISSSLPQYLLGREKVIALGQLRA